MKNQNHITTIFFVLLALAGWTNKSIAQPSPQNLFVLAGQSNMSGRGGVAGKWNGTVPPEDSPDPLKIFRLSANLTWVVAQDALHKDIDVGKECGVGPGMSFANAIKAQMTSPIGLVPCAIGGTEIKNWTRGQNIYENMVSRARAAATSSGGEIKALLWYQGESDTSSDEQVNSYRQNMMNLIQNVRDDFGLPQLPVIQVAIASGGRGADPTRVEKIRNIQKSIGLPNVTWVDAKGLAIYNDSLQVHLTTESQVTLGTMLAKQYLDVFGM